MLAISLLLLFFPDGAEVGALAAMGFVTTNLGWLYLVIGMASLVFCMWLAFGKYGHVKLGEPNEPPEYSNSHWIAMMFTAGIGAGLIVWGFAEPIHYIQTPPLGAEPHSSEAFVLAHVYPLFHWGIVPWAIYAVPAVPIAYMLYVKQEPFLRISVACEAGLPAGGREQTKTFIDMLIMLGIIGGTATSLGLGVPLVSAFVSELVGVEDTKYVKLAMLALWTLLFSASAYRGLKKGIKVLADINMVLALIAMLFILIAGPTLFILSMTVNSVGVFLDNFWRMGFWMDPIEKGGFPEAWTIFYWGWWLAFAAFIGLFIGRISRGRTIRQLVVGVIGWGSLGTCLFLAIAGGYSLWLESYDVYPVSDTLTNGDISILVAKVLQQLPLGKFTLLIFTILSIIFYATTIDSAAFILASVCTRNLKSDEEPPQYSRLVWAGALALLAAGLILSDRLEIVQSSTIVFSAPLIPIIILMSYSLIKWLDQDFGSKLKKTELALGDD